MSRTLAQIKADGYDTMTKDEMDSLQNAIRMIHNAVNERWPKEFGLASDLLLRTYGWHLRLSMHPNDLVPFMKEGVSAVDGYFMNKLRWTTFRLRKQAIDRFPHRRKMINSAFWAHWRGDYTSSVPLFLILSDGIFRELTGEDLFGKKPSSKTENAINANPTGKIPPLMTHIIDAVSQGEIIGLRFANGQDMDLPNVLSRNRILHGANPNYGSKTNAYKAISQFEFVIESVYTTLTGADI